MQFSIHTDGARQIMNANDRVWTHFKQNNDEAEVRAQVRNVVNKTGDDLQVINNAQRIPGHSYRARTTYQINDIDHAPLAIISDHGGDHGLAGVIRQSVVAKFTQAPQTNISGTFFDKAGRDIYFGIGRLLAAASGSQGLVRSSADLGTSNIAAELKSDAIIEGRLNDREREKIGRQSVENVRRQNDLNRAEITAQALRTRQLAVESAAMQNTVEHMRQPVDIPYSLIPHYSQLTPWANMSRRQQQEQWLNYRDLAYTCLKPDSPSVVEARNEMHRVGMFMPYDELRKLTAVNVADDRSSAHAGRQIEVESLFPSMEYLQELRPYPTV